MVLIKVWYGQRANRETDCKLVDDSMQGLSLTEIFYNVTKQSHLVLLKAHLIISFLMLLSKLIIPLQFQKLSGLDKISTLLKHSGT